ncbi:FUSC family protein, partial [Streptomyces sp. T21Q-yed]|nr:FUSC family protein [Streptomyces sp. T21Q-yed]
MRAVGRPVRARLRDRVAASDPGLLRLTAGLRTAGAIALAVAVLALLGTDVTHLVAGALAAMVATFAIREKQRGQQAVTLALGLPVALASMTLAAALHSRVVAGDLVFVALIFCAVYGRRFGDRGTALGLIGFQIYFVSLFVGATVSGLPELYGAVAVAFVCSALVRFAVVPETPTGVLDRLRGAFRARLAQLLSAQLDLLDAGPDEA